MENSYRRSQLIVPFGVGAIVDFADDTLMSAGLDYWPTEKDISSTRKQAVKDNCVIYDKRLQRRLSKMKLGGNVRPINYFLQPALKPDRENPQDHEHDMPFVRFPRWYFCPRCRKMSQSKLTDRYRPKCCKLSMYPMTFLIGCPSGHISDFPWREWLHDGPPDCSSDKCELYYQTSNTPGIGGVFVECKSPSCSLNKRFRSLSDIYPKPFTALNRCIGGGCKGEKPWLGENHKRDNCSNQMDFLQRAASNVYFAHTISSILIPPYSEELYELMTRNELWETISAYMEIAKTDEINGASVFDEEKLTLLLSPLFKQFNFSSGEIVATAKIIWAEENSEISNEDIDELTYRKKEYGAFLGPRPSIENRKNFDIKKQNMDEYSSIINSIFDEIILVPNIREVTALKGFSRIMPLGENEETIELSKTPKNWLPATEVRGEGIFLNFNHEKINLWAEKNNDIFEENLSHWKEYIRQTKDNSNPNFTRAEEISITHIIIHTFSHLFIREISNYAGYDTSSIKERIFASDNPDTLMSGLLIYTASGDMEGTLGGLVEQGQPENLERLLTGVIDSEICSNDPICRDTQFQGIQNLNGAACYSCALLPETCCEHNNTLLDRRCLFGVDAGEGFLSIIK